MYSILIHKSLLLSSVVLAISSLLCDVVCNLYWERDLSCRQDCSVWLILFKIRRKSWSSASSNNSLSVGMSRSQQPSRWHGCRNDSSRARSAAEQKPDHAGEQPLYGTRYRGITQFYLSPTQTTPSFAFLAEAGTHLPTRRDGRLSMPSWLIVYIDVLPASRRRSPIKY